MDYYTSEELWTNVHNTVQKGVTNTIPKKNKCKKAKWLSQEALQIAEKRKNKSERQRTKEKRYTQLNTAFQRIARRHKKAFLSEQRKEIEENNRMGKTRDLFKKTRDTKGTFHAKQHGPNRSRSYWEKVARLYRRTIQKGS